MAIVASFIVFNGHFRLGRITSPTGVVICQKCIIAAIVYSWLLHGDCAYMGSRALLDQEISDPRSQRWGTIMTALDYPASSNDDAAQCERCQTPLVYVLDANQGGGLRYTVSCPSCGATYFDFSTPPFHRAAPTPEVLPAPPSDRAVVCPSDRQLAVQRRTPAIL